MLWFFVGGHPGNLVVTPPPTLDALVLLNTLPNLHEPGSPAVFPAAQDPTSQTCPVSSRPQTKHDAHMSANVPSSGTFT